MQVCRYEVVLRREVPVEGDPGDPSVDDDPVDPDRPDPFAVEEAIGGLENPVPRR